MQPQQGHSPHTGTAGMCAPVSDKIRNRDSRDDSNWLPPIGGHNKNKEEAGDMFETGVEMTARLAPRLVPRMLWGVSGYRKLPRSQWRGIRAQVLEEAQGRCGFCGETQETGMICDEVWNYDPDEQAAQLTDLQILCPPCNGSPWE